MSAPCCGYVQEPGKDWGFLDGATGPGSCDHVVGERYCECCSRMWYRTGSDDTHEYEVVGDPPRYVGGPAKEDCPECEAELAAPARPNRADFADEPTAEEYDQLLMDIAEGLGSRHGEA